MQSIMRKRERTGGRAMSVLIKGMKMPENCYHCKIAECCEHYIANYTDRRHPDCYLVELPKKHGRLIDADSLLKFVEDRYENTWESDCYEGGIKDTCSDIIEKIDTMPTVIEAEDGA
jgi:hypothetical protein